jgi:hypothetical protein
MRNAENKKRRRAKGKGIGWKVEGVRRRAYACDLIWFFFVLVLVNQNFVGARDEDKVCTL